MEQGVRDDIDAHAEGFFPFFGRIVVNLRIGPTVADIALIRIVDDQSSLMEDSKSLGSLGIMFVNFGNPSGKVVIDVIYRVV